MPLSLDDYRKKLINKILFATSQEEVKELIDAAIKALYKNKTNGHIVVRLVDKITDELDLLNPLNKNAQQWSNIKIARIHFFRTKRNLGSLVI